jgi:hypothetical protein
VPAKLGSQAEMPKKTGTKASSLKPVPDEYRSLYNQRSTWLDEFQRINQSQEYKNSTTPILGAHLQVADANRGPDLLSRTTMPAVELCLDRYEIGDDVNEDGQEV